jgi:SAM-dependent methyltransferase
MVQNREGRVSGLNSYDSVPYPSYAMPEAHPDRLAAVGRVFGMSTVDPAVARVLEIGCSDGGHLIPFARSAPDATCLGIDLSPRQIEAGRELADAAGVNNLELRVADISTFASDEPFDYIICHGVYSWVPPEVREAILRVVAGSLAPDGVAYLSYNVWPGWALRQRLRELAVRAGDVDAMRRWMAAIAEAPADADPGVADLAEVCRELLPMSDTYLTHEFLEADNAPRWFAEVAGAAQRHGLQVLGDSSLGAQLGVGYAPDVLDGLRAGARGLVHFEQLVDLLGGRTFRQTLFVRSEAKLQRDLTRFDPTRLRWSCAGRWDGAGLVDDDGELRVDGASEVAERALATLALRRPEAVPFDELAPDVDGPTAVALGQLLLRGVSVGLIGAHAFDFPATCWAGTHPHAWDLARLVATRDWRVPSARHETISLDPVQRLVVVYADGSRDLETLAADVAEAASGWEATRSSDIDVATVARIVQELTSLGLFVRE